MESVIYEKWIEKVARKYKDICQDMKLEARKETDNIVIATKPPYYLGRLARVARLPGARGYERKNSNCYMMFKPKRLEIGQVMHRGGSKSIV